MPDPLSAVLLFFLIALGGVVLAMARYVAKLHENSVVAMREQTKAQAESTNVQAGLKGTLDHMSVKLDNSSRLDQQMVIALTELKATLK